jgi:hypothetical protein
MSTSYDQVLRNFERKARMNHFWDSYNIKVVIARESQRAIWKIILLSILLTENKKVACNILLDDVTIKVIEEVRSFDTFNPLLNNLLKKQNVRIGNIKCSLELIKSDPLTKYVDRLSSKSLVGVESPRDICYWS